MKHPWRTYAPPAEIAARREAAAAKRFLPLPKGHVSLHRKKVKS